MAERGKVVILPFRTLVPLSCTEVHHVQVVELSEGAVEALLDVGQASQSIGKARSQGQNLNVARLGGRLSS